jgi:hypothetical protein
MITSIQDCKIITILIGIDDMRVVGSEVTGETIRLLKSFLNKHEKEVKQT